MGIATQPKGTLTLEQMSDLYTKVVEAEVVPVSTSLPHQQLLAALFFFWDAFERSSLNFFLIKDTAKQVIADTELSGEKITLGLRWLEWLGGQQRIFKAFMEHEGILPKKESNKDKLVFNYKGIPVYLYLYDDNPTITTLDYVFYKNDTFMIPTPFKDFEENFDHD